MLLFSSYNISGLLLKSATCVRMHVYVRCQVARVCARTTCIIICFYRIQQVYHDQSYVGLLLKFTTCVHVYVARWLGYVHTWYVCVYFYSEQGKLRLCHHSVQQIFISLLYVCTRYCFAIIIISIVSCKYVAQFVAYNICSCKKNGEKRRGGV